jgi:hypothetical protein
MLDATCACMVGVFVQCGCCAISPHPEAAPEGGVALRPALELSGPWRQRPRRRLTSAWCATRPWPPPRRLRSATWRRSALQLCWRRSPLLGWRQHARPLLLRPHRSRPPPPTSSTPSSSLAWPGGCPLARPSASRGSPCAQPPRCWRRQLLSSVPAFALPPLRRSPPPAVPLPLPTSPSSRLPCAGRGTCPGRMG